MFKRIAIDAVRHHPCIQNDWETFRMAYKKMIDALSLASFGAICALPVVLLSDASWVQCCLIASLFGVLLLISTIFGSMLGSLPATALASLVVASGAAMSGDSLVSVCLVLFLPLLAHSVLRACFMPQIVLGFFQKLFGRSSSYQV